MPEPTVMELGMYIMPPETISIVHFVNPLISNTNIRASQISEENLSITGMSA
jgi:hypothetical protein